MYRVKGKAKHVISSWTKGIKPPLLGLGLLVISLTALLPAAVAFAQSVSFSPATNFTVGTTPWPVAIGDLNGDGKPDLAVANQGSNNVSILLGDGTGTFGAATNFTVGLKPYSVAIGDLNGDGKPDLATANYDSGNVSILLGTGTGTFGSATNLPVGAPTWIGDLPQSVAIGDLNGDGKLDLAVAKPFGSIVSILLGDGTGAFGTATDFPVEPWARSVVIGDFDGDGKPDLATANVHPAASNVSILLGDGTGAFGSAINSAVLPNPVDVAIGDFNGDGKLDLAVANANTNKVSVLIGVGNGTFGAATNFTVVSGSWSVAVGDLNGDGKPDLAVVNSTTNKVSVLLGDGTGTFGAAMNFTVGPNPHGVAIGDLDGDGKLDLAVTNAVGNNVSILLNTTVSPNQPPVANAGPDQTVEATSPSGASITLNGSGSSDPDGDVLTYNWTGLFGAVSGVSPTLTLPLGTHTVTLTVSDGQATATDNVLIIVQDTMAPSAECLPTTNPSDKNVPAAGTNPKSGQNPDGFYQLLGSDNVVVASIVVRDSNSSFVSNSFNNGDKVKITQAPGATPSDSGPGPGVIVSELKLKGDGILRVTDTSSNVTEVICRVAPLPK